MSFLKLIYNVENLRTNKIYIGKTTNLLNRANHYILEYRNFKNVIAVNFVHTK